MSCAMPEAALGHATHGATTTQSRMLSERGGGRRARRRLTSWLGGGCAGVVPAARKGGGGGGPRLCLRPTCATMATGPGLRAWMTMAGRTAWHPTPCKRPRRARVRTCGNKLRTPSRANQGTLSMPYWIKCASTRLGCENKHEARPALHHPPCLRNRRPSPLVVDCPHVAGEPRHRYDADNENGPPPLPPLRPSSPPWLRRPAQRRHRLRRRRPPRRHHHRHRRSSSTSPGRVAQTC